MRVITPGYVQALVTYADAFPEGRQQIVDEMQRLFDEMGSEDGGLEITTTSVNGRTMTAQVSMTKHDKFTALAQALKEIDGTARPLTYATFYKLER